MDQETTSDVNIGNTKQQMVAEEVLKYENPDVDPTKVYTFRDLAHATENFNSELLVGKGGFGRVYKGHIGDQKKVVAIKQLDMIGVKGNREFLAEVLTLSRVHHPNLINLVGYCANGGQRMLVYEYMTNGTLEDHLFDLDEDKTPFDWTTRMRIAKAVAEGLKYLHETADPPIIYRDLKASNIFLDDNLNPKLSDFGIANFGPKEGEDRISTRVMGTYGYCSPEYAMTGELSTKADVYSFGVMFLELISGRRAIDEKRPNEEQNLIIWAKPVFKDQSKFWKVADPLLKGKYPIKSLQQAIAIAAMCLQDEANTRPYISDILVALEYLAMFQDYDEQSDHEPSDHEPGDNDA